VLRAGHVLPPEGLSTLGFDTGRFPPMPPACYRASWQLPGPDFHRQQTRACRRGSSQVHRLLSSVAVAHVSSADEGSARRPSRLVQRLPAKRETVRALTDGLVGAVGSGSASVLHNDCDLDVLVRRGVLRRGRPNEKRSASS